MVSKENLSNIIRRLAGRTKKRMFYYNVGIFEAKSTSINELQTESQYRSKFYNQIIDFDNYDMYTFRILYKIVKHRRITMREIFPGKETKYARIIGKFHQDIINNFVNDIPDNAEIYKIEIIHGHRIYKSPADYRRKVIIGEHTLYVDQCSSGTTHVTIDENGCKIQYISKATKTYCTRYFNKGHRKYAESARIQDLKSKSLSFKRGNNSK